MESEICELFWSEQTLGVISTAWQDEFMCKSHCEAYIIYQACIWLAGAHGFQSVLLEHRRISQVC